MPVFYQNGSDSFCSFKPTILIFKNIFIMHRLQVAFF